MKPRRRVIFIAALVLLFIGLVLCGPAHHALHSHGGLASGDARGSDGGDFCDGCVVISLEAPASLCIGRAASRVCEREDLARVRVPGARPSLFRSPRGPPAHA